VRRLVPLISALAALLLIFGGLAPPASAQTLDQIAEEVDRAGFYADFTVGGAEADSIERANDHSIGFVWLDQAGGADTELIAVGVVERLESLGSGYDTVIVLDNTGVWVRSSSNSNASAAADAATPLFASGDVAGGIDAVASALSGGPAAAPAAGNDAAVGDTTRPAANTGSTGGGTPWFLILLLGLLGFFAFRWFSGKRRKSAAVSKAMKEDKAEIKEQLLNNADSVINLGDKVTTAPDDVRQMYEEASRAYQDVSSSINDASTVEEIDSLDDRIDKAEWQFQVIEARLDGRTPPPEPNWGAPEAPVGAPSNAPRPPAPRPDGRQPVPPLGRDTRRDAPALGPDESIFNQGQRRGGAPRGRSHQQAPRRRSRGGGMLGGMMKAGIGSLLLRMLLGGGLGGIATSRRTQRRHVGGNRGGFGGGGRGGLGGGVLR